VLSMNRHWSTLTISRVTYREMGMTPLSRMRKRMTWMIQPGKPWTHWRQRHLSTFGIQCARVAAAWGHRTSYQSQVWPLFLILQVPLFLQPGFASVGVGQQLGHV
jgi:hypothetical protein